MPACLDPTQVTLDIRTDAPCADLTGTGITIGARGQVEQQDPSTETTDCSAGAIGTIVIVPSDADDASFGVKVVSSLGVPTSACQPPTYGPACVVARRSAAFVPHTPLEMPIAMQIACAGVSCPEGQTCVDGACRSSDCVTQEECAGAIPPWTVGLGGAGTDTVTDLAANPGGGLFLAGTMEEDLDLGGGPLKALGGGDAFLASFSAGGQLRWSIALGGDGLDVGSAVAPDPIGASVYLLGSFTGTASFGGAPLQSQGSGDLVLARFTGWGAPLWSIAMGGPASESPGDVIVDAAGTLYVTGTFTDSFQIGGKSLKSSGGSDLFVAALSPAGDVLWANALGGAGDESGNAIAVDAEQNLFVTGSFTATSTLGDTKLVSEGGGDVLVASLDANGKVRWAQGFGSAAEDVGMDVVADAQGRVAVTGHLGGAASLGGQPLASGAANGFVAMLDGGGKPVWSSVFGGKGDSGRRLAFEADGTLWIGGNAFDGPKLGEEPLTEPGVQNPFVAALAATGEPLWARGFAAGQFGSFNGLAPAGGGDVFVAGYFLPDLDIASGTLVSVGKDDIFLARLAR